MKRRTKPLRNRGCPVSFCNPPEVHSADSMSWAPRLWRLLQLLHSHQAPVLRPTQNARGTGKSSTPGILHVPKQHPPFVGSLYFRFKIITPKEKETLSPSIRSCSKVLGQGGNPWDMGPKLAQHFILLAPLFPKGKYSFASLRDTVKHLFYSATRQDITRTKHKPLNKHSQTGLGRQL